MALRGQHRPGARIGGGLLGPEIGPGLQVVDDIDDAAADLAVLRAFPVGPMLLQVRPERPRKRAASGVRRKRGGTPASGSGMIAFRDPSWTPPVIDGGAGSRWRRGVGGRDDGVEASRWRHPQSEARESKGQSPRSNLR